MKANPVIKKSTSLLILGYGKSGKAAARYAKIHGASLYVSDLCPEEKLTPDELQELQELCEAYEFGGHSPKFLEYVDTVFVSPGIPDDLDILLAAESRGLRIVGELAMAAPVFDSLVVAVTGTNGKTTVTNLLGALFTAAGKDVFVGGNIGTPLLESCMQEKSPEVAVLELSSFQLEYAGAFRPNIALLLNVTPDHIDRHGTFENYRDAKAQIFCNQGHNDIGIISDDDPVCREIAHMQRCRILTFGHNLECSACIEGSRILFCYNGMQEAYTVPKVMDTLTGRLNCAAALLAARIAGCSQRSIAQGLQRFQPPAHRNEFVAELDGVRYFDDSKGTNTGAVISALEQAEGRVVLIAGGRDKGEDYRLLRDAVRAHVRHLVVIGEAGAAIAGSVGDLVPVTAAASMQDAVKKCREAAQRGDVVLLSPACSSFDMFSGYAERGNVFQDAVYALQEGKK